MKLLKENTQYHQFPGKMLEEKNSFGNSCSLDRQEDDKRIFFSIQIERYLKRKIHKRFCSEAEKDVINDIISDSWDYIKDEICSDKDEKSKNAIYYSCIIVFPFFVAEEENIISVDFNTKSVLQFSGNYMCGSTRGSEELDIGSF